MGGVEGPNTSLAMNGKVMDIRPFFSVHLEVDAESLTSEIVPYYKT